jgi:hypothetical protein
MVGGPTKLQEDEFVMGFEVGFNAAKDVFEGEGWVQSNEVLKTLPAGSVVRDGRGRVLFKTQANGWVTTAATHVSSMYVVLPAEVIHHEGFARVKVPSGD